MLVSLSCWIVWIWEVAKKDTSPVLFILLSSKTKCCSPSGHHQRGRRRMNKRSKMGFHSPHPPSRADPLLHHRHTILLK